VPTYQYACTECGERTEAVQSFTDAPLTECPACSGPLRKVFSAVGVVFKGSGFYKTDSRSSNKPAAAESKSSGESSTSTTSGDAKSSTPASSSSDSKPAAAPARTASTPASKTA
jgi:putative FmdB family regulatory protein